MNRLFALIAVIALLPTGCYPDTMIPEPQVGSDLVFSLSDGKTVSNPVWSPTGNELAFKTFDPGNGRSQVYIMNLGTHQVRTLLTEPAYVGGLSWSPDGKYIAYNSLREILTVPTDGSIAPKLLASGQVAAWSPDGKEMAIFDVADTTSPGVYTLQILNLETEKSKIMFTVNVEKQSIFDLSWSPDSTQLIFSLPYETADAKSATRDIQIYDLETRILKQFTFGNHNFFPTWSPSGNQIAYLSRPISRSSASIIVSQVNFNCSIEVPDINGVSSLAWSPDGSHLAYSLNTAIYLLDLAKVFGDDFVIAGPRCP